MPQIIELSAECIADYINPTEDYPYEFENSMDDHISNNLGYNDSDSENEQLIKESMPLLPGIDNFHSTPL